MNCEKDSIELCECDCSYCNREECPCTETETCSGCQELIEAAKEREFEVMQMLGYL